MFPLRSFVVSVAMLKSSVHAHTQVRGDSVPSITRVATMEILRLGTIPGYLSRKDILIGRFRY